MNDEQYQQAKKLKDEKVKLKNELDIWEKELTAPGKLGYLQGWNNNHATKLETNIPESIFDGFRVASMNAIKLRLAEIDAEFCKI